MKRNLVMNKILPCNQDFEIAVLACLILDNSLQADLEPEDFYFERNALIFEAIKKLQSEGSPIGKLTIQNTVKNYDKVGGDKYLLEILENKAHTGEFNYYVNQVRELSFRRQMINNFYEAGAQCFDKIIKPEEIIFNLNKELSNYKSVDDKFINITEVDIMELAKKEKYYSTGLRELNNIITGIFDSDLIIIAGRTSTGKTAFSLWVAYQLAKHEKVLYFSLEMSFQQLANRIYSSLTNIPYFKIRGNNLNKIECDQIKEVTKKINSNFNICDQIKDAAWVESRIRNYFRDRRGVAVIDYLQLFGKSDNRNLEIGTICRRFKNTAKDLNIPILLLSQFSRGIEFKTDQEPTLSSLRDSGEIEQHADIVLFVHYKNQEEKNKPVGQLKIIVPKNRGGKIGYCNVIFNKTTNSFYDVYSEEYKK